MIPLVTPIAHWDDVKPGRRDYGHIGASWADLGSAAGSATVGVRRIRIDPGKWSTPAHVELAEEEIFYVLGGAGLSWQDGATYEVAEGDCLVHLAEAEAHTLRAGPDGLDVLAFGTRVPAGGTLLRRAGVIWHWPGWAEAPGGKHPFEREADAGEPELPAPSERPGRIVATAAVEQAEFTNGGDVLGLCRDLGEAAGSERTGLNHVTVPAGKLGAPPHCHSAEEELFVVLAGAGTLLLGDAEHPLQTGHVVSRPAGTRIAHALRAGDPGLTYLAYGTREPNDIAYYPRSGKISFRGVGVIGRLERLDYWDGEP
jgi:uncharacterized cupin superfamily protein